MGEVILYIASSLDGFIADEDGGVEWLETVEDSYDAGEPGGSYQAFFDSIDCLLMGANTYEQVLSFGEWPYGDRPTVVMTRRDLPPATDSVEFHHGELRYLVANLTDRYDRIWLVGGGDLARSVLAQDLIDEIRLSIVPVLLGNGVPLFGASEMARDLHLTDVTPFDNGIVELRYGIRDA